MILAAPAFGVQSTSVPCERWVCKQAKGMLGGLVGWAMLASLCRVASPPPHGPLQSRNLQINPLSSSAHPSWPRPPGPEPAFWPASSPF